MMFGGDWPVVSSTPDSLAAIFAGYGTVKSAKVLEGKADEGLSLQAKFLAAEVQYQARARILSP